MAEQIMQETAGKAIPAGYKQTEVGVIPEDWKVKSGEEITVLIGKGASPRWQGFGYTSDGMLFVTSENVRDGYLDISEPKYLPLEFHEKLKRSQLHVGDILINLVGASIGRSCYIDIELGEANINQAVSVFRLSDEYNARFISCYFSSSICIGRILDMQVDAARPNISLGDLRRFLIPLPPSAEQTAIANVLSDSDALINALEQLIAKKQAIKTATMQQLLTGRTRLPQFARGPDGAPKSYKSSELGQIPEDWDVVCAGDLGKFRGGNGFPVIEQGKLNGEYPFYKVSDMNNEGNDVYMSASNNWISKEDQSRIGSFVFPSGCIVFAKVGAAVFLERKKILSMPSCIDNNMAAFELNIAKCDVNFVYHFLQSIRFGDFVSTTALPSLNASVLSKIKIIMPLIKEQTAIATILSDT